MSLVLIQPISKLFIFYTNHFEFFSLHRKTGNSVLEPESRVLRNSSDGFKVRKYIFEPFIFIIFYNKNSDSADNRYFLELSSKVLCSQIWTLHVLKTFFDGYFCMLTPGFNFVLYLYWEVHRINLSFKELRNRFPACRAGTTALFVVPARQAT